MRNDTLWDMVIIGGGINGAGLARDAAGRGLSVLLCEQGDLASGTSSTSSKLIHGGLRYLEYFEFRLVREALAEREVLMSVAPHLITPMRFVLPLDRSMRPAWMIRMGLFLYDHLSRRRRLKGSRGLRLREHAYGGPLRERYKKGFVYSDCWVDDSRLVVMNAMDAAARGAVIQTRTRCEKAERVGEGEGNAHWVVTLRDNPAGRKRNAPASAGRPSDGSPDGAGGLVRTVRTRVLVNAAGPWVDLVMRNALDRAEYHHLSLVKGSHIIVPRMYVGEQAYILQNNDRRVVFVLPFLEKYSLIGTTDQPFEGNPAKAVCDLAEVEYLCKAVNRYMDPQISPKDVVWSFAGVRPLFDDTSDNPSAVSREYVLELEDGGEAEGVSGGDAGGNAEGVTGGDIRRAGAPLLSIIGGKITAYRQVAENAMEKIAPFFPGLPGPWSGGEPLPGGDISPGELAALEAALCARHPGLTGDAARRLVRAYGDLVESVLGDPGPLPEQGRHFGGGLYQREVEYLMRREWARTAEDVLWRRSKLGLELSAEQAADLEAWMKKAGAGSPH